MILMGCYIIKIIKCYNIYNTSFTAPLLYRILIEMAGGLLNLVATGNQNVILNSNPQKSFFKSTYKKYTNFGLQKFRIDFDGQRKLRLSEESKFTFYVPRYADLLMDTYVVVTLPTIWSPIMPPKTANDMWAPYEFKWIENIGSQMIKEVVISVGGQILQKFSGRYLLALAQRDFDTAKKEKYNHMTGNVPELYNPGCSGARINQYPNAYYTANVQGAEPSIRGRKLYIPINAWFTLSAAMAFPLVCLQYNMLQIDVTLRPVQELFTIRDVLDAENGWPTIRPDFNQPEHQLFRFLQPPPDVALRDTSFTDRRTDWNADVHIMATYCFLSSDETKVFAANKQQYLIKAVYDWEFNNITGNRRVKIENSLGMVSNWMFYFRRSDVNQRNEWSNYTNWPYNYLPYDIIPADDDGSWTITGFADLPKNGPGAGIGPGINPVDLRRTGIHITGDFKSENQREILQTMGIILNGKYRENVLDAGVYNYIEKYTRTSGAAPPGLYCYNFCLNTDPLEQQPTGAINMSKFTQIELEISTHYPPMDPYAQVLTICDPITKEVIGVNKPTWNIYTYTYDMILMEERYNILTFMAGNCGLMYAR